MIPNFRKRLDGRRLFLTGGTGFFGKWLLATLRNSGAEVEVTVLSRDPKRFLANYPEFDNWRNLRFLAGDVRDFPFPPGRFDLVIHAATDASAKLLAEQPEEMHDVIVSGTRRMLNFAEQAQAERFLFTSSGAVYGVQPPELDRIPESFPCNPVTAYGRGKLEAEQLVPEILALEGPVFCEVLTDPLEQLGPKAASKLLPDGSMVSCPLEDLAPFLPREEFRRNMLVPPVDSHEI